MRTSKGFTLIELLVATTILTMVITTVYASYHTGLKAYRRLERESFLNQNMRQAWRTISRDLRCAYMSGSNPDIRFIGVNSKEGDNAFDTVTFTTYLPDIDLLSSGLTEVSYYIDNDPRTACEGLVRADKGFPSTVDDTSKSNVQEVAPEAKSIKLRYFNGMDWQDSWGIDDLKKPNHQSKSLPLSVEITIQFSNNDSDKMITTQVPVLSN